MSKVVHFGIEVEDVSKCIEKKENYYSQAHQDLFVLGIHKYKKNGTFVDIGCAAPREHNNTFLLEKRGWTGLSFDILNYKPFWDKHRKTPFIHCDATQFDYKKTFNEVFKTNTIDFLSLDIDTASNIVLKKLPFNEYNFSVITIEHDLYASQSIHRQKGYLKNSSPDIDPYEIKQQQQQILKNHGYICLVENISVFEKHGIFPFEDWWVSPSVYKNYKKQLQNIHSDEVLNNFGFLINRDTVCNLTKQKITNPEFVLKGLAAEFLDDKKQFVNLLKKPKLFYVPFLWLKPFFTKIVPNINYNFSVLTYTPDQTALPEDIINSSKVDYLYWIDGPTLNNSKIKTPTYKTIVTKLFSNTDF